MADPSLSQGKRTLVASKGGRYKTDPGLPIEDIYFFLSRTSTSSAWTDADPGSLETLRDHTSGSYSRSKSPVLPVSGLTHT